MAKFINPDSIVGQMDLAGGETIADFGCGGGYFTIPAARAVGADGSVYAVDVMPDKLAVTQSTARHGGFKNVTVVQADLEKLLTGVPEASCDAVIICNILHQISSREALMRNAYRVLKTGGVVLAVEWKKELTPIGPSQDTRLHKDDVVKLFEASSFRHKKDIEADSYHYAVLFVK